MFFDHDYIKPQQRFLAGCDEVGRGPLAGPVVACCVFLDLSKAWDFELLQILGVTDSKKLSDKKREEILRSLDLEEGMLAGRNLTFPRAEFAPLRFRIEEISALEIDRINILQASLLAMKKAYMGLLGDLKHEEGLLLIDGNKKLEGGLGLPIVKGDQKSLLIGLSSIIAKVYRDRLMKKLGESYPEYGFEKNAGYPTEQHREALIRRGPTEFHRKTFKGVKEFYQGS